jgi:hypothetical protein
MHNTIGKPTRTELFDALRQGYQQAAKAEKTQVLVEFVAVGLHSCRALSSRRRRRRYQERAV